jgi:hypothetical protein
MISKALENEKKEQNYYCMMGSVPSKGQEERHSILGERKAEI